MTVAPERKRDPASGNAIREGISVTAPVAAAMIVAVKPVSDPSTRDIVSGGSAPRG
ncbi:MAG: hypothetical protein U5N56_13485 [Candidatus Marinimicrobia bacterium]|nr:hypothetical protein [Candidatus Neomarinimicrobiota bacterium]